MTKGATSTASRPPERAGEAGPVIRDAPSALSCTRSGDTYMRATTGRVVLRSVQDRCNDEFWSSMVHRVAAAPGPTPMDGCKALPGHCAAQQRRLQRASIRAEAFGGSRHPQPAGSYRTAEE